MDARAWPYFAHASFRPLVLKQATRRDARVTGVTLSSTDFPPGGWSSEQRSKLIPLRSGTGSPGFRLGKVPDRKDAPRLEGSRDPWEGEVVRPAE